MPCPTDIPKTLVTLMDPMARLARHLTGNRDQAQDICQEVLLKLWTRLQAGHEIEDMRAYAMAAVRNQYRQSLRNQLPGADLAEVLETTAPEAFAALALRELNDAMTHLTPDQARLIRLVAAGETSPQDLARITGWPLGTVMSRLARARAELRQEMGLGARAPVSSLM